jgi:hypothetical protein
MAYEWWLYFRNFMQGTASSKCDKMTGVIAVQTKMVTLLFFP